MQKGDAEDSTKRSPAAGSVSQPQQAVTVTPAVLASGRIQALTGLGGQQTAIGVLPAVSGVNLPTVSFTLPRTISAAQSSAQTLHLPASSLSNSRLVSPQTINIIQRQLSSGVVGLSTVSAQGLQQVLQASGSPLTFVTATSPEAAAAIEEQQRKVRLLQQQRLKQLQHAGSASSSSGGTIHHLAQSGSTNPVSNPNQLNSISLIATNMSGTPHNTLLSAGLKRSLTAPAAVSTGTPSSASANVASMSLISKLVPQQNVTVVTAASGVRGAGSSSAGGPSPKKIKLEEKPAPNKEIENLRKSVISHKRQKMKMVKSRYRGHLTELFYLQGGGNMIEFNTWKKRPSQPLLNFLEGSKLDSDDDDEELQEKRINDEVKVLTSAGSNIPLATPVAISTTLPPSVTALSQQAMNSSTTTTASLTTTPLTTATTSELQQHLSGKSTDIKPNLHALKSGTAFSQQIPSKGIKSTNVSPGRGRHSISSVYENVTGGSQDVIVERAKQEAQVLQRVTELRKEGLWSAKRLPRVQEPPRQKAHWDYLLEEMTWLAADFIQERKWKKAAAKKLARMVSNHFKEQEQKELRAEKEEGIKLKKIASQMAKMVKEFWTNIEKVVQYKQTTRLEEKKKKALDLHLSFIVDQTEKYSSWLTAGLQNTDGSHTPSLASDAENTVDNGDVEFHPVGTASDDEETIEREEIESGIDEDATKKEVEALQMESELPLEELLKTLPREMLDKPSGELPSFGEEDNVSDSLSSQGKDGDFKADDEVEEDAEETIEEQEKHEKKDYSEELGDLKAEGEMSVDELMKKYAGAYDSDFEMPEESSGEEDSDDEDDEESSESEKESESSEEEAEAPSDTEPKEDGNDEQKMDEKQEDMGLEFLVKKENAQPKGDESSTEGPGKEFNDIAAAAQSLQPKGYTLETTEVKTKVPFLLKHTLREYQHVGLDWLATMHDKRLNGILADEMGLGKTIQTIAMLAHLACDKGVWGPHLIVVPTSVMLNWEMEFKKWCPAFKILTYYGSIKERKLKRQGWTKTNAFHVCITSYKLVVQDHQAFRRKKWKYFILDEAQNIKNFKSQRWQMLLNFSSQRRLLLTGTPLQNSLMELWSLMHFLMPNVFQSHSEFKEWFSNPLTGMIEGSQEYNESLVRRLHKVLRPFLLRRLKNEVEKQMPQKFEHVVMCRLSKRQRYLYDDFMSQTKTKETLATGHFMSVINILMQLRKVCNHPNLFDPRPIVSPFKMEGLVYKTASLATRVLEHDPFNDIDIYSLYPNLAEMESDLPAFVSQRVKQLKATGKLIEEVDDAVDPPPRPPVGQLKNVRGAASAFLQTGKVSPMVVSSASQSRPASPLASAKTTASSVQSTPTTVNSIKLLLPPPSSSSSGTQQSILIPNPSGSGPPLILPLSGSSITSSSSSPTSAAIASAKLISSQLQSGVLQLVQTSSGHQILTSVSTTSASASTASAVTTTSSTSTSLSLLKLSSVLSQPKPVMRVSPFVVSSSESSTSSAVASQSSSVSTSVMSTTTTSKLSNSSSVKPVPKKPIKRSELFVESVYRRKQERRQHVLSHMAKLNRMRCDASPPLGPDVQHAVNCIGSLDPYDSSSSSLPAGSHPVERSPAQRHCGYVDCLFAQNRCCNHSRPDLFWRETKYLQSLVKSPEEWLHQLQDILSRFVFVTPPVISPAVCMRVSHPCQSSESHKQWLETRLRPEVLTRSALLHPIQCRTSVTFPELRLIQYDCGKLQTLDLLLRQLKSGQHRVLIFTQMTKMLDVLEAFLNFHGHRYLRLDGTTKVEQRQYLMDRFNADPRIFCFILSTRSGGIGVNLTGADTVVFYDSDWNPTMDAQAQDRCHRIGQTRDVHIYRLVSEMTVEENILKKANQKRLLGDLAIEGGNFTTAFFKEQTISDLFAEPSGLESLMEDKEKQQKEKDKFREEKENERMKERERQKAEEKSKAEQAASSKGETEKEETKKDAAMLSQFEQALCKAEDETDAQAAQLVQAEQKAELAEFDENIPWDEREAEMRKDEDEVSKVEMELAMLDKELTPIERYAVTVMEAQMEPETAEELKMAEEDIENSKKDWELARLKALKEEEERKAELEEDEMLYIYSKDDSQVKKKGRKPLKKTQNAVSPRGRGGKASVSGSDADEGFPSKPGKRGRRASERLSPQKLSPNQIVRGARGPEKKKVSVVKVIRTGKPGRPPLANSKKKVKAATNVLQKKVQNGPKGRGRGASSAGKSINNGEKPPAAGKTKAEVNGSVGRGRGRGRGSKVVTNGSCEPPGGLAKEKKGRGGAAVKVSNPTHLHNGHTPVLVSVSPSKIATQTKNALLKQQAQQAAHITISPAPSAPSPRAQLRLQYPPSSVVANIITSPPQRPQLKPTTPKSPPDPNVPPPWSNPNLVIRTRKAAVHSPVVIAQTRATLPQQSPTSVLQQSLNRTPLAANAIPVSIAAGGIAKIQGTPDRNIFQLFTSNTSGIASLGGVTLTPTIRQVGPIVGGTSVQGNQLRTATLINPASLVNSANLAGARFITTGMGGQSSVVVSAPKPGAAVNVGGNVSNITLVPTVINASGGQTIINPVSGATILNTGGARAVLNTTRLGSPITLQGLGSLPVAVNLLKTSTGLSLPVRPQQILQTSSLAQVAGQSGYVLITPRAARAPTPGGTSIAPAPATLQRVQTPISLVQTLPTQNSQAARVHLLAQVPAGATIVQQPAPAQKTVNAPSSQPQPRTDGT